MQLDGIAERKDIMGFNGSLIPRLIAAFHDDRDTVETIENALMSFEHYHAAIYELEIKRLQYSGKAMEADVYRELIPQLDRTRTRLHNALLTQVSLLNRIAAEAGLPPVYDGIISEDRPYRREVANAVLEYVRQIIDGRS
ncbi:MAG: DUF3232 domain-containing protein [Clostridia bacterium]|nr:DUF3232 domain-containing protein [Clostridia bacterium]